MKRQNLVVKKVILNSEEMGKVIDRMVYEMIENLSHLENVAIVGIRTRGVILADRIVKKIEEKEKVKLATGTIDISLYRDDFFKGLSSPKIGPSVLNFDPEDHHIVLVDDVMFTGRTVRAAIEAVMDYGRPKSIKFVSLIDRGHRELPIQPDVVGKVIETKRDEAVAVLFSETDGEDKVVLG
ncbi:MAG TPA: bifunctional pyr operon transcriptional regulator/uracil phosphoribosyltransferase PyrR [bacterium]|nr:bifunctional pyr operon transcriptional regulator/uracil phosphoribosyltransferase PyrR [bacterium]